MSVVKLADLSEYFVGKIANLFEYDSHSLIKTGDALLLVKMLSMTTCLYLKQSCHSGTWQFIKKTVVITR
jgi:hypothetical protein